MQVQVIVLLVAVSATASTYAALVGDNVCYNEET